MAPSALSARLVSIAAMLDRSRCPSISAVRSELRRVLASVDGGVVEVRDRDGTTWAVANPSDHNWIDGLWALTFGASGSEHVLVWADSVEDALEEAAEWLKDTGKIGYFVPDDEMRERYDEALAKAGGDEEKATEVAEQDLTLTEAGYIPSHEWFVDEASPELTASAKAASAALDEGDEQQSDAAQG